MVAYGKEIVTGSKINSLSVDTYSSRETTDGTILGDLLVKDSGGVKVNPFG